jgi:acetoin utilization deacetylase AcuC-like enzyme
VIQILSIPFTAAFLIKQEWVTARAPLYIFPCRRKPNGMSINSVWKLACNELMSEFSAQAVVVSMGLTTHMEEILVPFAEQAFVCRDRQKIASSLHGLPTVIIQEGGYLMETIGEAASVFGIWLATN